MMPLEIIWAITVSWWAGDILCRVCSFFRIFGLFLSSNIVVCISIDRYVIKDDTAWRTYIYGICLPYLILTLFYRLICIIQGRRKVGAGGALAPLKHLADQLTLSRPGGHIISTQY
jgi:hypothetical protein